MAESATVMENILFPVDWRQRWPEFYEAVTGYQKLGKNANDDAPDMLTGIVERGVNGSKISVLKPGNGRNGKNGKNGSNGKNGN